jgi:hypothetical protein
MRQHAGRGTPTRRWQRRFGPVDAKKLVRRPARRRLDLLAPYEAVDG